MATNPSPKLRYLPSGSLRRQRRRGRIEGAVAALSLACLIGFAMIAVAPAEIYRPAPATKHPVPEGGPATMQFAQIPPCLGTGKDCSDPDEGVDLLPRVGPRSAPHLGPQPVPRPGHLEGRTVPEPSTLALIVAALVAAWRSRT